MASSERRQL